METQSVNTSSEFVILDFENAYFYENESGILNCKYNGEEYKNVDLKRLMPFYQKYKYISVMHDKKEIAIIRDIDEATKEQADLLKNQLDKRYFCPQITRILNVKEKMGYLYLDIETTAGKNKICIGDFSSNIRNINGNDVVFIDIEGNRYIVNDYENLDKQSRTKMEIFL